MDDIILVILVIGASWLVFSIINICITMAVKKKGGGIHPFFMFCPIVNVLSPFIFMAVCFDEKKKKKE